MLPAYQPYHSHTRGNHDKSDSPQRLLRHSNNVGRKPLGKSREPAINEPLENHHQAQRRPKITHVNDFTGQELAMSCPSQAPEKSRPAQAPEKPLPARAK